MFKRFTVLALSTLAVACTSPRNPELAAAVGGVAAAPASCSSAVEKARDNIGLRIQQTGAESRATAQVHLYLAGRAAEAGDDAGCWKELGLSRQFVR